LITNDKEKYEFMLIYSTFNELVEHLKEIKIEDYIEDDTILQFLLTASKNRIIDFDELLWDNNVLGEIIDCNNCLCNNCAKRKYDGANGYYWHGKCERCNKNNCNKSVIECDRYLSEEKYKEM